MAAGQSSRVWVESLAGGWLSDDGGRTFRAPLSTSAFQQAQVAQATLLSDGRVLLGHADRLVARAVLGAPLVG